MSLIKTEEMQKRLAGLDCSSNAIIDALDQALDSAQLTVESLLDTRIELDTAEDVFALDRLRIDPQTSMYVLKLSNGFINASSVVVTYGGDYADLQASPQAIPATLYAIKAEAGMLFLSSPTEPNSLSSGVGTYRRGLGDLSGAFIRVAYTSGYDAQEDMPAWLIDAWCSKAINLVVTQQVTEPKPQFYELTKIMDTHAFDVMARKFRRHPFAIRAEF